MTSASVIVAHQVTCTAPVNIATIKYWGKRDDALILPVNSSLSATLNQADLKTQTTVLLVRGDAATADRIWLNGTEEDIMNPRLQACLAAVRARCSDAARRELRVHIVSKNNFPTAAGLASSAAGYACLAFTLARAFDVAESFPGELSLLARLGSGSACRSLYGGFVRWSRGERADGLDSLASQVVPASHWPELRILILVVSDHRKEYSSTSGQETSVQTSELLKHRAAAVVPERMARMEQALRERDFAAFGKLTMQDSNQFHAVCLDTYPPIFYLNETSRAIIRLVHNYNAAVGELRAAYTFDAGPNAVVFVQQQHAAHFGGVVRRAFPVQKPQHGAPQFPPADPSVTDDFFGKLDFAPRPDGLKYVISTSVGEGPKQVELAQPVAQEYSGYPF
jgi:diphosphomevalonate decarboxylase